MTQHFFLFPTLKSPEILPLYSIPWEEMGFQQNWFSTFGNKTASYHVFHLSAADVKMEIPVLEWSLKSSTLKSTSFQKGKTFRGVVTIAVEQSRRKANMVAQRDGNSALEADPRILPNITNHVFHQNFYFDIPCNVREQFLLCTVFHKTCIFWATIILAGYTWHFYIYILFSSHSLFCRQPKLALAEDSRLVAGPSKS